MGRPRVSHCKQCSRHIDEAGPLSARKLCEECSNGNVVDAIEQITARQGPTFDRYVNGLTRYASTLSNGAAPQTTTSPQPGNAKPPAPDK